MTERKVKVPIRRVTPDNMPPEGVTPRRYKSSTGYIRLRWRVGPELLECYEHRWVMQCFDYGTHVHHRNGIKDDNRPENLEVIGAVEHARHHQSSKTDWVMARLLYEGGMSTTEVGVALGISAGAVSRSLRRNGVQPRSLSESVALSHKKRRAA